MTRRELLALAGCCLSFRPAEAAQHAPSRTASSPPQAPPSGNADITLRIGEITLDLAPGRSVRTTAYNGQVPGPLLRAKMGRPLAIDVWNDTRQEEIVHWHGLHVPPEVDGAREEGTPAVMPRSRRRYEFVPRPAGTRWYHSHGMTGRNLKGTTYTGQFGMFVIESDDPGSYDQEVPIQLHEWEPRFVEQGSMHIDFRYYSINGKMLGAGEPIRVRNGQRVLFRLLNASATLNHRLALPGHSFYVTALDGYTVSSPKDVPIIELGPGERVDALVTMNRPGVWVLGEVDAGQRKAGMGIVVEYADQAGVPEWRDPRPFTWDYTMFGADDAADEVDARVSFVFRETDDRRRWTINGRSYPKTEPIIVQANKRYRWLFDNQSAETHPIHLHRHAFELKNVAGRTTSGLVKDVVMVPAWKQVEVDVLTTEPGPSLFHCHQQFHMDTGFMMMVQYSRSE
jgi:FtsP/CotA-like multicopper oxidase with cupredoxin domain